MPHAVAGAGGTKMARGKALVVEDDATNRLILETLLRKEGYQTLAAEDGLQAIRLYSEQRPDIIFMDVMMPNLDGYQAAAQIKQLAGEEFVPIIFLTALNQDQDLLKCVESGGDDFLTKPFRHAVLSARIKALERLRDLYRTVQSQRRKIEQMHQQLLVEEEIAERVFSGAVTSQNVALSAIHTLLRSASTFNGDLLLTAYHPTGGINVLLGDFTGHGLASAIGALPASEVFRSMTAKGYAVQEILETINTKLKRLLPTGMFLTASCVNISQDLRSAQVWNGSMPAVLVLDAAGKLKQRVESQHLPLGILAELGDERSMERIELVPGDRILLCSDGVVEARAPSGERFGVERYLAAALNAADRNSGDAVASVSDALSEFCDGRSLDDDASFVEIPCRAELLTAGIAAAGHDALALAAGRGPWRWTLELHGASLRCIDPVPLAISELQEVAGLKRPSQPLITVLSELYRNALDHGVLGLDSGLKATPEGRNLYQAERERRLAELDQGWVRIGLAFLPSSPRSLLICVEDSGDGFDYERMMRQIKQDGACDSGMARVSRLCQALRYEGDGNRLEAVYSWHSPAGQ